MDTFVSQKFRFYSFISMALLVFVHGYNLVDRYLLAFSVVHEPLTFTTFIEYFLANGIFRFRIPMLFIISGYLFSLRDDKPYGERMQKRTRTLLVPYLIWSMIGLLLTLLLEQSPLTRSAVMDAHLGMFGKPVGRYSFFDVILQWIMVPLPFQLWFIRCLLIYNLLYPLLKKAVLRAPYVTFGIAGLLWLTSFNVWLMEGEGLLFFTLGIFLSKKEYNIQSPPSWLPVVPILIAWVCVAALKTWLAFQWYYPQSILFPVLIVLHKFVVLSGLIGVWYCGDTVVRFFMARRWFTWLSAFSFIIYALHVPLTNYAINLSLLPDQHFPGFRLLAYILLPLTIITFCVLVGAVLRKTVPPVYSLLTGGRGMM